MKIAIICNFDKEITPYSSGGTEVFAYLLISNLIKDREIEKIHVFGVGKDHFNNKKVKFHSMIPENSRKFIINNKILNELNNKRSDFFAEFRLNIGIKVYRELKKFNFDIIHDNSTSSIFNTIGSLIQKPIVTTLHTNFNSPSFIIPYYLNLTTQKNHYYITIANHQLNFLKKYNIKNINIYKTIYNGIDINRYLFSSKNKDNFGLWLGRTSIKHNKGIKEAIMFSSVSKNPLRIITHIDEPDYFKREIKPLLVNQNQIDFIDHPISLDQKIKYYQNAKYFIYPLMWEEPFGLVFLEAMACGTPIIAFAKGSVPEIIVDGVTGFIVNSSDKDIRGNFIIKRTGIHGLCEAVERINNMNENEYIIMRKNCRKHVENNFNISKMISEYKMTYKIIINKTKRVLK